MSSADTTNTTEPMDTTKDAAKDTESSIIRTMQDKINELQAKTAHYEAKEAQEHAAKQEELRKNMDETNMFFNRVCSSVAESERERVMENAAKARTLLNEVPNMDTFEMAKHAPLVAITCHASQTFKKMDALEEANKATSDSLKRALEELETCKEEIVKERKISSEATQLAEARQQSLEKLSNEYQQVIARASRHDFSNPGQKQYEQALEDMKKYMHSKNVKAEVAPTEIKTGTVPEERNMIKPETNLVSTSLCASAGSSSEPEKPTLNQHVDYLTNLFRAHGTPSLNVHAPSRLTAQQDAPMTDAQAFLAQKRAFA